MRQTIKQILWRNELRRSTDYQICASKFLYLSLFCVTEIEHDSQIDNL